MNTFELPVGLKLKPIGDRVVVKLDEQPKTTAGGLHLPDNARDRTEHRRGTVLAVGPGAVLANGNLSPMDVMQGERVLFEAYAGMELDQGDDRLVIIHHADVIGVVED